MPRLFARVLTLLIAWTFSVPAVAQVDKTQTPAPGYNITTDRTLGLSFLNVGSTTKHEGSGYTMLLQSTGGSIRQATAEVAISQRRSIDLSGSYGGIVYLDTPMPRSVSENLAKVDSVQAGVLSFRREYWAAYAGMGSWESVINCTAFLNGQYYILSLHADITLGKPGEVVDGRNMNAEVLRGRVTDILCDGREPVVKKFNDLLSSFQLIH